jgi:hypothetical protein
MLAQISYPAIIEPDYDEASLRSPRRFKKIRSTHQSKYYTFPCPPSVVPGGVQHPANQSSIPHTFIIAQKQERPKVKDCIETECSSKNVSIKRKRGASTRPHNTMPLMKPPPLCCHLKIPSSPIRSMIMPLGRPLAVAPSLPRVAAGRAIPKLSLE